MKERVRRALRALFSCCGTTSKAVEVVYYDNPKRLDDVQELIDAGQLALDLW